MSDKIKNIKHYARSLSFMAVIGWFADTSASVLLHRGWWTVVPAINMVMTVWMAIRLHKEINRA